MKNLLKVLLLALFAVVVFMPMNRISQLAYWSLFVLMFCILYLYYRTSYWVGEKDIEALVDSAVKFSVFCGKVPPMASEDLVRGRLVVTDTDIVLYQRYRRSGSPERVKEVWSIPIDRIEKFSVGRVVGLRDGLILTLTDGDEARFTIFSMKKKKAAFTQALGWEYDEQ
jgi:Ca2+/Na+ antiporter